MLELKSYQNETVQAVATFCDYLRENPSNHLTAWGKMRDENYVTGDYRIITKGKYDDIPIPNVCIKIPTGGGKTYTATKCMKEIMLKYREQRTGLIIWVVPTEAIYTQTVKNFKNGKHHCRKALNQISPIGNAIIKEKFEDMKPEEIENNLVVLVIIDRSIVESKKKDFLKIHQENSQCLNFFPSLATADEEKEFAEKHSYLQFIESNGQVTHKPIISKSNAIRLHEPIIVVDESHKNCSDLSKKEIEGLNPSFIFQLSATPKRESNIIYTVSAQELYEEDMIKLPIVLNNETAGDWESTLRKSHDKLLELEEVAQKELKKNKTYIRPMMVVRVEHTGRDQIDKNTIHAEKVKKYMIETLGYKEHEVCLKTSECDEIKDQDLMSEESKVKIIITKNALQEGWDCPFAYILTILDNPTKTAALTQLTGRIMRLPYAKRNQNEMLNKAYVFCKSEDTYEVVKKIKSALQKEGLENAAGSIEYPQGETFFEDASMREKYHKDAPYFLTTMMFEENGKIEPLSYRGHLLSQIKWSELSPHQKEAKGDLLLEGRVYSRRQNENQELEIGLQGDIKRISETAKKPKQLDAQRIAKSLQDEIPNPWQAMRIAKEYLQVEKKEKGEDAITLPNEEGIKNLVMHNIKGQCERMYKTMYEENIISLDIDTNSKEMQFNRGFQEKIKKGDRLKDNKGLEMQNSLFEPVNEPDYNSLERKIAIYLDRDFRILKWWYRMPVRSRLGLQGWKEQRVYPDFLAMGTAGEIVYIESKGKHLKGSDDTKYKEELANYLSTHKIEAKGTMTIKQDKQQIHAQVIIVHEEDIYDGKPSELEKINRSWKKS